MAGWDSPVLGDCTKGTQVKSDCISVALIVEKTNCVRDARVCNKQIAG
jgi:hypothetical protein